MSNPNEVSRIAESVTSALYSYKQAVSSNAGISSAKERLKNVLFTHCEVILGAIKNYDELLKKFEETQMQIKMLDDALAESDEECAALKKKLKEHEISAAVETAKKVAKRKPNKEATA